MTRCDPSHDEARSRTGVNLTVKGRNLVLTEAISAYAEEKIGRLGRYLADGSRCEVEIWTEKNPSISDNQVVEATIFTKGPVIRAREASPDIRASIDLVFEKLERQVKKYRGKLVSHQGPARETFAAEGFALPARGRGGRGRAPAASNRQDEAVHGQAHDARGSGAAVGVGRATTSSCSPTPRPMRPRWCTAAVTATTG